MGGGLRKDALTDLEKECDVTVGPDGHRLHDDREWVLDHIAEYDSVIVAKMAFDNELTLTMIMASARRLRYYDHALREGVFLDADEYNNQGYPIEGKILGILGMGRIGQQVARFAKALGMKIIYHNRHQLDAKLEEELNAKYVDFDILVKEADFLSLHAPATDETYHIINADVFKQMKETAYLINVARGSLVDSDALIAALKKGEIAGAALDVFENEPHPRQKLVDMDNVIMTPHAGSATHC